MKTMFKASYIMPDIHGKPMRGQLRQERVTEMTERGVRRHVAKTYGISPESVRVFAITREGA